MSNSIPTAESLLSSMDQSVLNAGTNIMFSPNPTPAKTSDANFTFSKENSWFNGVSDRVVMTQAPNNPVPPLEKQIENMNETQLKNFISKARECLLRKTYANMIPGLLEDLDTIAQSPENKLLVVFTKPIQNGFSFVKTMLTAVPSDNTEGVLFHDPHTNMIVTLDFINPNDVIDKDIEPIEDSNINESQVELKKEEEKNA
jgi:hypothetical protein